MLAFVVFLNGMAVMVLEMAGARLLAPELGTSIIVWTSLIGVILASLSAGYWLGGRLADRILLADSGKDKERKHAWSVLSRLLVAASATAFMAAALGVYVPGLARSMFSTLHMGTVFAALALFALPALLCGMVSPYAVRLAITSSETSGAIIGRLNAIGTVGSIVGTFLGGFVLLAWFSTNTIILGVAVCLLAASALVSLRPLSSKIMLGVLLVAGIAGNIMYDDWVAQTGFNEHNMPITIDTSYSSMRVAKGREGQRELLYLMTDPGSAQSGMYVDDPLELVFSYTKFYALGTALNTQAKRVLMLGGGGYSVPKWLLGGRSDLTADFTLDVVELDPGMTRVAEEYFKAPLSDSRMRVFHEDARTFVNRAASEAPAGSAGPYDLIFADIFNSWYTVPFHVGTAEAARNIHALLADDGIYVMNVITAVTGDNGRLLRSIRNAFLESFAQVHVFPVQQKFNGSIVQNVMLLAFKTPRELPDPAKEHVPPHLARLLSNRWTSPLPSAEEDVPALRDSFAPVERYTLGYMR